MNIITKIYRILWLILFLILIFFDRTNSIMVFFSILLLLLLSTIAILRSIESRNQWRKFIADEPFDKEME